MKQGTQAAQSPSMRLAAALALLVVGLGALWWTFGRSAGPASSPEAPQRSDVVVVPGAEVVRVELPGETERATQGTLDPKVLAQAYSFDGKGTIRGSVALPPGMSMPREWELELAPHPYLQGSERAIHKRVRFEAGEREFRVDDLPFGGYRVRALAKDMNSFACDVLLVRGSPDQHVQPQLLPAGWLDGRLLDAQARPAEGVEVRLVDPQTRQERRTLSDAAGAWEFQALLDGDYELYFFGAGHALLGPESIAFRAPRMHYPDRTMPACGEFLVRVIDALGRPAVGAQLSAYGRPTGRLDAITDERGECRLRWLAVGSWRISVRDEVEGLSARSEIELGAGESPEILLRLSR